MVSAINPLVPADGVAAVKADIRANLATAKSEIEALQLATAVFPASGFTGRRNRLINGNMYGLSRGVASVAIPTTGVGKFAVDRWYGQTVSGGAAISMTRQLASEPITGTPHNGYIRLLVTTAKTPAATDYHVFGQTVEAIYAYDLKWGAGTAARPIVVSFWARASITGNYAVRITAAANAVYITSFSILASNTWEYKSFVVPVPITGSWDSQATTGYMKLNFDLGTGSSRRGLQNNWLTDDTLTSFAGAVIMCANTGAWLDLTGVQLEQDTSPTPWERPDAILEQLIGARYFQTSQWNIAGLTGATVGHQQFTPWITPMRTTPTATTSGVTTTNVNNPVYTPQLNGFLVLASGVASGGFVFSGNIAADAEIT